ncbi:uncharacterized protein LOC135335269 isoform X2 [Halichondria panicea]|uniref:uncharacterized protein LOC135335269 isoform X2 n=1 Tax=Halichondria panicea TaxID=6063 RepID=UPI00312B4BC1
MATGGHQYMYNNHTPGQAPIRSRSIPSEYGHGYTPDQGEGPASDESDESNVNDESEEEEQSTVNSSESVSTDASTTSSITSKQAKTFLRRWLKDQFYGKQAHCCRQEDSNFTAPQFGDQLQHGDFQLRQDQFYDKQAHHRRQEDSNFTASVTSPQFGDQLQHGDIPLRQGPYQPNEMHTGGSEENRVDSLGTAEQDPLIQSDNDEETGDKKEVEQTVNPAQRPKIFSQQLAVAVGPEKTITENKSYHNEISGDEAIKRLMVFGDLCYLTRHSGFWKCYVLSVCWNDKDLETKKFRHYKIELSSEKVKIEEGNPFDSLEKMLEYYKTNRIDPAFPNIGECITQDNYKKKNKEIKAREREIKAREREREIKAREREIKARERKAREAEEQSSSCTII